MIDLNKEREAFELANANIIISNHFKSLVFINGWYDCDEYADIDTQVYCTDLNSDFLLWLKSAESKQAEIESLKSTNHSMEEINNDLSESLSYLKAKIAKYENPDFVLVSKECPDPDFADALFDLLGKESITDIHGEHQFMYFDDIDVEKIWELVLAQEERHE